MGADLYIDSINKRKQAMYGRKFEQAVKMRDARKFPYSQEYHELVEFYFDKMLAVGYFRDSYNSSNLSWLFGFSYWNNDLQLDDQGNLPPSEAKRWLQWLKDHEPVFESNLRKIRAENPNETTGDIDRYFRMKYLRLRVFLRMAIKLNEPIIWSV